MIATDIAIHPDMPEDVYHASAALSASGAKTIIRDSPARYAWNRTHPVQRKEFDRGHIAHSLVLGVGQPPRIVDAAAWNTNAAKSARAAAYTLGQVPILRHQWLECVRMARQLRAHPIAGALLDPDRGEAEQSAFWHDAEYGIDCRVRTDWRTTVGGRLVVVDYKTTTDANPRHLGRTIANLGYHQQDAWYTDAMRVLGHDDPAFVFVFQEVDAPYLVSCVEIDPEDRATGAALNAQAKEVFAECTATGEWPGYASDIVPIRLPAYTRAGS